MRFFVYVDPLYKVVGEVFSVCGSTPRDCRWGV